MSGEITRRKLLQLAGAAAVPVSALGLVGCTSTTRRTSSHEDATSLSAIEVVGRIRDGSLSAELYLSQLIKRWQASRSLNATISFNESYVLEQARSIDRARARGERMGPLAGLPFVVKDQLETLGYPTTAGTAALKGYRSKRNAAVVDAMLRDGAILFATANMHELASGGTSSNPTFGFVRNPYDPGRIPGGSSGGTAAAIAARIVPAGLGEDTGGSVRIPAGFCGISGLRPSTWPQKLYSDDGLVPPAEPDDMQTVGPMARTVADVALLHSAITREGVTPLDNLRGVRIAIPDSRFWPQPALEVSVAKTVQEAFARLREAGAILVEVDFDRLIGIGNKLSGVVASGNRERFAQWLTQHVPGVTFDQLVGQITSKDVKDMYAVASGNPGPPRTAQERADIRKAANAEYADLLRSANAAAVAFPNPLILPPEIGAAGDVAWRDIEVNGQRMSFGSVALRYGLFGARLGAPGLNLPAGMADRLPVGLELEALPGDDARLLGLGMAVEKVLGPLPLPPEPEANRNA